MGQQQNAKASAGLPPQVRRFFCARHSRFQRINGDACVSGEEHELAKSTTMPSQSLLNVRYRTDTCVGAWY